MNVQEKQAKVLTLHADWSFRVWAVPTGRVGSRRGGGGGSLLHEVDARGFLDEEHRHQVIPVGFVRRWFVDVVVSRPVIVVSCPVVVVFVLH